MLVGTKNNEWKKKRKRKHLNSDIFCIRQTRNPFLTNTANIAIQTDIESLHFYNIVIIIITIAATLLIVNLSFFPSGVVVGAGTVVGTANNENE